MRIEDVARLVARGAAVGTLFIERIVRCNLTPRFQTALRVRSDGTAVAAEGVRATAGQDQNAVCASRLHTVLDTEVLGQIPHMIHGTKWDFVPSILRDGLRPGGGRAGGRADSFFSPVPPGHPSLQAY